MITLLNTSWIVPTPQDPLVVLSDVSDQFKRSERVGILAAAGSGKSSMARLLARIQLPDAGQVVHDGRVSWPIGFAGMFHPDLTALQNLNIISKTLGEDPYDVVAFCKAFTGFEAALRRPMKQFSPAMRGALAWAASMVVPCDMYIADEVIGYGDPDTRAKCQALLDQRLTQAGLVFLSKNASQLEKTCTSFRVLVDGALIACPDIGVAQDILDISLKRKQNSKEQDHD